MVQTELHRHLDVCTRPATLLELLQAQGLEPQSTSLAAFREKTLIQAPMKDLASVLGKFGAFQRALHTPDAIERVGFEAVEDCWREGTRAVELRFSPSFATEFSGLSWREATESFDRGIRRACAQYAGMRAGMICIATRDYGADSVAESVEFFLKNRDLFVGFDLAGDEAAHPGKKFESSFKRLRQAGARITVHSGEASGPESIWEALEYLGAERIGHGVACARDPKLMEHLRDQRICLEICPTSNWLVGIFPRVEDHVLPKLLRAGVPVSLNTDDPGIMNVTLASEIDVCRNRLGMTPAEIQRCFEYAAAASFLPH
ncbi:MAG: adenosine deaminase [Bacteriovoracia bacterium]